MTFETVVCAKCHLPCPLVGATKITATLTPRIVVHYHPECYDPWGAEGAIDAYGPVDPDPVNAPAHYREHPSGIECIQVVEHMGFNLGNAVKYIWRCDLKRDAIEDLEKARWYLDREIAKRKSSAVV